MSDDPTLYQLERYDPIHKTCTIKGSLFELLVSRLCDNSSFNMYLLQFILMALMYINSGNGKYWKILFYTSISGLLGCIIENSTISYLCRDGNENTKYMFVYSFFINEIFWIITEYSIPYLNLIKMKAYANGKAVIVIEYIIYIMFSAFAIVRIFIGYERGINGYLSSELLDTLHGITFGIMALADFICSIFIIYFVRVYNKSVEEKALSFHHYIKRSSYIVILAVDFVSFMISVLFFLKKNSYFNRIFPSNIDKTFRFFKVAFQLILGVDVLLFKFEVNFNANRIAEITSRGKISGSANESTSYIHEAYASASNLLNKRSLPIRSSQISDGSLKDAQFKEFSYEVSKNFIYIYFFFFYFIIKNKK